MMIKVVFGERSKFIHELPQGTNELRIRSAEDFKIIDTSYLPADLSTNNPEEN